MYATDRAKCNGILFCCTGNACAQAEEAEKRKLEEEEAARKTEELRLAAEAKAKAAAEERALKEKMENMPKVRVAHASVPTPCFFVARWQPCH